MVVELNKLEVAIGDGELDEKLSEVFVTSILDIKFKGRVGDGVVSGVVPLGVVEERTCER